VIRLSLVLSILLFASWAQAADRWKVTDGDTLVAPWGETLRVRNIDTPEAAKKCKCRSECILGGRRATAFTREAITKAGAVTLSPYSEPGRRFKEQGKSMIGPPAPPV
jgi:endonuclease YncB( thermonuclease family)